MKIKVYSDYVCPFCFIAKKPFEEAIQGKNVEVEWIPYELRPSPTPQLDPIHDPVKQAIWNQSIEPLIKKLDLDMKLPNLSPHPYTDLAFEGYYFAKSQGKENEYNNAVFNAFYIQEQNIGEIDVLTQLAVKIGLDGKAFKQALVTRQYQKIQKQELQLAYEKEEIKGIPTFIIGKERISGVVSKETFEKIINQELKNNNVDPVEGRYCDTNGKGFC